MEVASIGLEIYEIDQIEESPYAGEFTKIQDHAHYKGAPWSNVVGVERGITLNEAFEIAAKSNDVSHFFYVKGGCMILEIPSDAPANCQYDAMRDPFALVTYGNYINDDGQGCTSYYRGFAHGDVVFFGHDTEFEGRWLGTAPGLADTYAKK